MPELVSALGVTSGSKGRHLLRIADWTPGELELVLDLADELKHQQRRREPHRLLEGRVLGLLFDKPSTRTRVSFEWGLRNSAEPLSFSPPTSSSSHAANR